LPSVVRATAARLVYGLPALAPPSNMRSEGIVQCCQRQLWEAKYVSCQGSGSWRRTLPVFFENELTLLLTLILSCAPGN